MSEPGPASLDPGESPLGYSGAIARGTALQVGGKVVGTALSLSAVGLIAHHLGVQRFGGYSLAILVSAVASTVADLGLAAVATKRVAETEIAETWGYIRVKTAVQVVAYGTCAAVVATGWIVGSELRTPALLAIAGTGLAAAAGSLQIPFQVQVRWLVPVAADLVARTATLLAVIILIELRPASIDALVGAVVVGNSVGLLFLGVAYLRAGYPRRGRIPRQSLRPYLLQSFTLGAVLVLGFAHFKVDSVIIAATRSHRDLGIYSTAYRFVDYALLLPGLFLQAAFPALVRARATGRDRYAAAVDRCWKVIAPSAVLSCAALALAAPPLVALLGGARFNDAVLPLRILAIAVMFAWLNTLFAQLAVVAALQRTVLIVSIAAVFLNIAANLVVIPRYGYNGAAWTTVGSESLGAVAVAAVVLRSEALTLRLRTIAPSLISAVIAIGAAWGSQALGNSRQLTPLIGLLVLTAMAIATRSFEIRDLRRFLGERGPA